MARHADDYISHTHTLMLQVALSIVCVSVCVNVFVHYKCAQSGVWRSVLFGREVRRRRRRKA